MNICMFLYESKNDYKVGSTGFWTFWSSAKLVCKCEILTEQSVNKLYKKAFTIETSAFGNYGS